MPYEEPGQRSIHLKRATPNCDKYIFVNFRILIDDGSQSAPASHASIGSELSDQDPSLNVDPKIDSIPK